MDKACIRCGATSTPLWRPEALAGPKVLCNACGVKVLYPIKAKRAKPNDFSAAASHQSHSGRAAKRSHQQSTSVSNKERSESQHGNHHDSNPVSIPDKSKKQKVQSTAGDVMVSPAQTHYVEVERKYNLSGSNIVRWIITDSTIDDTRDFDNVIHAQAFIDECWAFISADFRDKASAQGPLAANDDLELLLAAAAHTPEPSCQDRPIAGRHDGMLHEAAAAADQIKLPSEPGPSTCTPDSPSASRSRQAAAPEAAAKAVHGAGAERQLTSPRPSHSSVADVRMPANSADDHERPKAESAVQASAPPQWPRHSKQMANVTALHGGGKKSRPKQAPCPSPPAGFAVKSSPLFPGGRSFQSAAGVGGGPVCPMTSVHDRQAESDQAQRPIEVSRVKRSLRASSRDPAAGGSSMVGQDSQPTVNTDFPMHSTSPALSVSINPQDLLPATTQDPCNCQEAQPLPQATGDVQQHRLGGQDVAAQPSVAVKGSQEGDSPSGAALDSGTALQPGIARLQGQTREAASGGPWLASSNCADDPVRDLGVRLSSNHMPMSWGLRRPRTRSMPRQSDGSTTDLAVVAAAATAEAEQAAASAMARAHTDYDESASQSDAQPHSRRRAQNSFCEVRRGVRSHSLPAEAGSAAQQGSSFDSRGLPNANLEPPTSTPRRAQGRNGGPRSGRNHHRAGALPSNLHKALGYIGSNFLGVNGVRHGPEFPLRWKAGTWDPALKKTVYIGSFDTEREAAKAVDTWHVSCGRAPVNFVDPFPATIHARTYKQQTHRQHTRGNASVTNGSQEQEEPAVLPVANDSEEHPFVELKNSDGYRRPKPQRQVSVTAVARQADPEEAAQQFVPQGSASASLDAFETKGSKNGSHPAAVLSLSVPERNEGHDPRMTPHSSVGHSQHFGHALNKPQGQSAGVVDAQAVRRAVSDKEGMQERSATQTYPTRNCRGVLFDNGKWRAQIKVEGHMQLLGHFDNREDAAQAYAVARRQKLLMHVS